MVSMDQFFQIFFTGLSAIGAIVSGFCAYKTWLHTIGSKEAKAKAEEEANQAERSTKAAEKQANQAERSAKAAEEQVHHAEELLEQMSDISSNLWHPEFELAHVARRIFSLRNVTMGPIKVLDVVNSDQFVGLDLEKVVKEFQSGEIVRVTLDYYGDDANLRLRIDGRENILCVPIEHNLNLLK